MSITRPVLVWSPVPDVAPHEWAEDGLWMFCSFNPLMFRTLPSAYSGTLIPLKSYLISFDEVYEKASRMVFPNYLNDKTIKLSDKLYISRDLFTRIVRIWEAHEGIFAAKFDDIYVFEGVPTEDLSPADVQRLMSWADFSEDLVKMMNVILDEAAKESNIIDELKIADIIGDVWSTSDLSEGAAKYVNLIKSFQEKLIAFLESYKPESGGVKTKKFDIKDYDKAVLKYVVKSVLGREHVEMDYKTAMDYELPHGVHMAFSGNLEYFLGWIKRFYEALIDLARDIAFEYDIKDFRITFLNLYSKIAKGESPYPKILKLVPDLPVDAVAYVYGRVFPVIYRDYLLKEYQDIVYWAREISALLAIAKCLRSLKEGGFVKFEKEYDEMMKILSSI